MYPRLNLLMRAQILQSMLHLKPKIYLLIYRPDLPDRDWEKAYFKVLKDNIDTYGLFGGSLRFAIKGNKEIAEELSTVGDRHARVSERIRENAERNRVYADELERTRIQTADASRNTERYALEQDMLAMSLRDTTNQVEDQSNSINDLSKEMVDNQMSALTAMIVTGKHILF